MAVTAPGDRTTAAPSQPVRARSRRAPVGILGSSSAVALLLVAPLVFLLVEAAGAGVHNVAHLIWRQLTASLLWNTIRLMVVVTLLSAVVGTLTAWCVERTDLPGRRIWAVLVVVPFAIPDFVVSFGWASLWSWVQGFKGAVIVMTLAVYPLVYLPVSAALRSADPNLEDVARSLGVGRIRTFVRVTLGQAKGAIFGGCVLVALVILAEYGAFEILAYQTFTTEIFTEFNVFQVPTACALSLVLVLMSIVVLSGEMAARGRGRVVRTASFAQRVVAPKRLGAAKVPVLLGFIALVGLALGVPVGASIYWILEGGSSSVTGITGASILDAGWHTAAYSATAAALATLMALPVAILSVRHTSRISQLLERSTYLVLAMPGVVIAFALGYFSERYANGFAYQSAPMLVVAYAILFFPLALVAVRASVAYFPATFEEVARSLGRKRLEVFRRVTIPLVGPGLAAAFSLVFLAAVTELTATLILRPTGTETLATQFWSYEQNLSYGQAAPFALVMILVAALPSYVVGRYFDRLPTRASAQT